MHRRLGCLCPNYYFSFFYIDNFDYLLSSQQRLVKLMVSWTYIVSITELINPKLHPECIQLLDKSSSHRIWNGKEQNQIIWTKEGKVHLGKRLGFTRRGECQKPRITSSFAPAHPAKDKSSPACLCCFEQKASFSSYPLLVHCPPPGTDVLFA